MSIDSYNGTGVVAMRGKDCVVIASDKRFGIEHFAVSSSMHKTFRINEKCLLALSGLPTDVQTVKQETDYNVGLYELRQGVTMSPDTLSGLISGLLYQKRFGPWYVSPVIAGISNDGAPFLDSMDCIGSRHEEKTIPFVVAGTCSDQLYGMCESLYRPDLPADELFEVVSQCLLSAVDRDPISGWGAEAFIMTKNSLVRKDLKTRQD
ncbi:hypothetical protein MHBO_001156 [Bonamia ostreae]|uniref:Proteasome subunit beta n=1 Tax=Bonamia ostreae TaxID=126728 RepID=A0ABV2AHZ5_9EUKA